MLSCADAKQSLANLVQMSKQVATQIEEMRENARIQSQSIKKITEKLWDDERKSKEQSYIRQVKSLLLNVTSDYKRVMAYISQKCIQIMGTLPCRYALVGLGSLARNEITPYSDFEHVLLLQNLQQLSSSSIESSRMKEYFRWYSVLFHIIVLNLQESILPNVAIPCLNDTLKPGGDWFWDIRTPQGISFDCLKPLASKVPLGRTQKTPNKPWTTELIKSVEEMVKYVEADEDLKNGYKLGDMLTRTCYVDGDETIYDEFCRKRKETLKQNPSIITNVTTTLKEDLTNFDLPGSMTSFTQTRSIDIKRVIYRSITLFISALGRLHDVDEISNFDIIDEFLRREVISEDSADKLSHAVAVACHIRLSYYVSKKRQDDTIYKEDEVSLGKKKIEEISNVVNSGCLVKCIVAGMILQFAINKCNDGMYKVDYTFNVWSFSAYIYSFTLLELLEDCIKFGESYFTQKKVLLEKDIGLIGYYLLSRAYLRSFQYEKQIKLHRMIENEAPTNALLGWMISLDNARCLFETREYPQAICVTNALIHELRQEGSAGGRMVVEQCFRINGRSKMMMSRYHEALSTFRDLKKYSSQHHLHNIEDIGRIIDQARVMRSIAGCLCGVGRLRQARHVAREGCNIYLVVDNVVLPASIKSAFHKLLQLMQFREALKV